MKQKYKKSNLKFSANEMKWLRTPKDIWADLTKEFNFTIDCCASDKNHLLPRYYTKEDNCLTKDWTGEVAYIHPMFDGIIGKFVEKAYHTKNFIQTIDQKSEYRSLEGDARQKIVL